MACVWTGSVRISASIDPLWIHEISSQCCLTAEHVWTGKKQLYSCSAVLSWHPWHWSIKVKSIRGFTPRDRSIGLIPDWIWSCAGEWRGCNPLSGGMHMAICACCAQALIPKLMGAAPHDAMLTVGNNELTYVCQFYTFCLEKMIPKIKMASL
jgi:hypothetical protein